MRKLQYESPGLKTVRRAAYCWFDVLVKLSRTAPEDPFVQLYQRLKAQHQGKPRWLGRVRWKVIAKMITTIYHCLRKKEAYNPAQVLKTKMQHQFSDNLPASA